MLAFTRFRLHVSFSGRAAVPRAKGDVSNDNVRYAGTIALAVAIIHANFITAGGRSHYLMGVQLICTYLLISSSFLFTHDDGE